MNAATFLEGNEKENSIDMFPENACTEFLGDALTANHGNEVPGELFRCGKR